MLQWKAATVHAFHAVFGILDVVCVSNSAFLSQLTLKLVSIQPMDSIIQVEPQ